VQWLSRDLRPSCTGKLLKAHQFSPPQSLTPIPADIHSSSREHCPISTPAPKNPEYRPEEQYINIKAAIKLYEEGEIDGTNLLIIVNGKATDLQTAGKGGTAFWHEGRVHQYAQRRAYGHGPQFHEVSISLTPQR